MKAAIGAIWLLLALPAQAAEEPPPTVGVRSSEGTGFHRVEAVLPGRLLAAAVPRAKDGRRSLWVLVAPEGQPQGPRRLLEIDLTAGTLVEVGGEIPAGLNALDTLDLEGDGDEELLLAEPGWLGALEVASGAKARRKTRHLVTEPGLDLRLSPGRQLRPPRPAGRPLRIARVGELLLYGGDGRGGLSEIGRHPLPILARRQAAGLTLTSPPATTVTRADGRELFFAGPETVAGRRLRTVMIDPSAAEDERQSEAWSQLAGPSSIEQSWYVLLDDRPTLVATTLDAEKLALFEKQKLRFFPLVADRTRAGRPPSFEITTESYRWQPIDLHFGDRDGDGRDDVVVTQPEGLGGKELVVDLFLGNGNGRFQPKPRRVELPVRTESWQYGADVDGDGQPELAAIEGSRLVVFAGNPAGKKKLLDPNPRWSIELSPAKQRVEVEVAVGSGEEPPPKREGDDKSFAPPEIVDLDGDGRAEVVLTRAEDRGRGVVVVVGLR